MSEGIGRGFAADFAGDHVASVLSTEERERNPDAPRQVQHVHAIHEFGSPTIGATKGIPKNLSSQDFGEVWVNFLVRILTKTLSFMCRRRELFRKFLGSLRMILCH